MTGNKHFDLLVIGAGSGGVRAARIAAGLGKKVAVIEKQALGGTCVNAGCVPKKLFVYASHYHDHMEDAAGFGWSLSEPSFNWEKLLRNKNEEIRRLNRVYEKLLLDSGAEIISGYAKFINDKLVEVDGQTLSADKILITCGGRPFVPEFPGKEHVITSNEAFHLEQLPERILIVGGGYIAVEFASIFHGLGVEVTQFYRRDLFLRGFDMDLRNHLAKEMKGRGINLQFNSDVKQITKTDSGLAVTDTNNKESVFGEVMYATGRVPLGEELGLENTSIQTSASGQIVVNNAYETSAAGVFALGDITGGKELTPVATAEAMAFVSMHFTGEPAEVDYSNIPSAVFSQPNLGTVGLTEDEARQTHGEDITIYKTAFRHMKHTLSGREEKTFMKLVVQTSTDKVLGAHMAGDEAGEIIQGIAVAIRAGATKSLFDSTIGIHPTAAEEFVTLK
jgi:glutathione reductase (NADPH)